MLPRADQVRKVLIVRDDQQLEVLLAAAGRHQRTQRVR
jgi:hypothetical protein